MSRKKKVVEVEVHVCDVCRKEVMFPHMWLCHSEWDLCPACNEAITGKVMRRVHRGELAAEDAAEICTARVQRAVRTALADANREAPS